MAMSAALTQTSPATFMGTSFNLAITNTGASALNVMSCQVILLTSAGTIALAPYYVSQFYSSVGGGAGGNGLGIQVGASATVNLPFEIQIFAHAVTGGPATPSQNYIVTANIQMSDGTVFTPAAPAYLYLNAPTLGQPGSPPDVVPVVGQLVFSTSSASALAL